jgi:glycerol-1-phosphate dehydrogenase [NAD(P)+]
VLAAAPPRLLRAGLGDSACRPTAQADWLLAHLVLGRPYREAPFALLATEEPALLADPAGLLRGDREALRALVRTLVLSGIGMTLCDGSYPASQGEHLISHYVEAMGPPEVLDALHGEQIAVATVAMARLQDRVLERSAPPRLRASTVTRESVLSHFGGERGEVCWRELAPKLLDEERAAALTAHLAQGWDAIRSRIREVTLGADRHDQILAAAGAPRTPADLRWPEPLWQAALRYARLQRNRYTFMDLDADMGAYGA